MDLESARAEFASGKLMEVVIEPATTGNGWVVLVKRDGGEMVTITDHAGVEKVYHTIDHATEVAKEIGFDNIRVEERF